MNAHTTHRRAVAFIGAFAAAAMTFSGCASETEQTQDSSTGRTLTGKFTIYDGASFRAQAGECVGGGPGYEDLAAGSQVTIMDEGEKIVGVGAFGVGRLDGRGGCVLPFEVDDLEPADFYQVVTDSGQRPTTAMSAKTVEDQGWEVEVEVGDPVAAASMSGANCLPKEAFTGEVVDYTIDTSRIAPSGRSQFPIEATISITSKSDTDADIVLSWVLDGWSELMGSWDPIGFDSARLPVGAGETVEHTIRMKGDLLASFDYDLSRTRFKIDEFSAIVADRGGNGC